jgi:hypothetical protein
VGLTNALESPGRGANEFVNTSWLLVLITHHVLSRAVQRSEVRTVKDLIITARVIIVAATRLINEQDKSVLDTYQPDAGWPVYLKELRRDSDTRQA